MSTGTLRAPGAYTSQTDTKSCEDPTHQGAVFEVLSNERRRQVVHYLLQCEADEVTLRDLSWQVAAWENGIEPGAVTLTQRKRVYTALQQSHLPILDEYGFVVYDAERSVVRPTDRVGDLRLYLDMVPPDEVPWSAYYAGLGVLGLGLVAAKAVGVFPFTEVPSLGWAAILSILIIVSGLIHAYNHRRMQLEAAGSATVVGDR